MGPKRMAQQKQSPCNRREDLKRVEQAMSALKLALLELAPCLECFEIFLHASTRAVAINNERKLVIVADRKVGQQEPLDRRLAARRLRSST